MKKDIAVAGPKEFTIGFEMTGAVKSVVADDIETEIEDLKSSDHDIVVVRQEDYEELPDRVMKSIEESTKPVFVRLSKEPQIEDLNNKIEKAIGADISNE